MQDISVLCIDGAPDHRAAVVKRLYTEDTHATSNCTFCPSFQLYTGCSAYQEPVLRDSIPANNALLVACNTVKHRRLATGRRLRIWEDGWWAGGCAGQIWGGLPRLGWGEARGLLRLRPYSEGSILWREKWCIRCSGDYDKKVMHDCMKGRCVSMFRLRQRSMLRVCCKLNLLTQVIISCIRSWCCFQLASHSCLT